MKINIQYLNYIRMSVIYLYAICKELLYRHNRINLINKAANGNIKK